MPTARSIARPIAHLEPAHMLWLISRLALLACIFFSLRVIFGQGLNFWPDLIRALPATLWDGLYAENMMIRLTASIMNLSIALGAFMIMRATSRRLRFAFDHLQDAGPLRLMHLPGPTMWQARLNDIAMRRKYRRRRQHKLFPRLDRRHRPA